MLPGRLRTFVTTPLLACALGVPLGCGTSRSNPPDPATCPSRTSLKAAGACSGRLIGTALATAHLSEEAYASAALEFDYATPEPIPTSSAPQC